MGLDMFAYSVPKNHAISPFSYTKDTQKEIHYWRKHPALHEWMETLWTEKMRDANYGYLDASLTFNTCPIELNSEDLDRLEKDIKCNNLSHKKRFFSCENSPDEERVIDDLTFIHKARQELSDGNAIYYDSWW
jgi:hypothetical protein